MKLTTAQRRALQEARDFGFAGRYAYTNDHGATSMPYPFRASRDAMHQDLANRGLLERQGYRYAATPAGLALL